ncbi:MAG: adenylyl-sulfate kinase [Alphaproteobacteria bacterium]
MTRRSHHASHIGGVVWLTGLPGSGKTTLAEGLGERLSGLGWRVRVLDGDRLRGGLCADLGFSPRDRAENLRRAGEVAALFVEAGFIVVAAFVSPCQADRDRVRGRIPGAFHEVHLRASLEVCEQRDPKGLYRKARAGQIVDFTGISAPYEVPLHPELGLDTGSETVEQSLEALTAHVQRRFRLE